MRNKMAPGFTLVEVLIAMGIAGILAAALATMVVRGQRGMKSTELRSDLNAIRKTILDGFDCQAALGHPPTSSLPLNCAAYSAGVPVIRKDGSNLLGPGGKIGEWTVNASCSGGGVVFTATKPGNDPLTGVPWSSSPSLINPNTKQPDLFRGSGNFCSGFFASSGLGSSACPPGQVVTNVDFGAQKVVCSPGMQFGGIYSQWVSAPNPGPNDVPNGKPCAVGNALTGSCSCPAGYTAQLFHQFARTCVKKGNQLETGLSCTFYSAGSGNNGWTYGWLTYVCYR